MYQNLENILKPIGHREGRALKLMALMILLIGILIFLLLESGATWENNKRSFLMIGALAVFYIAAIPLGRIRTRRKLQKNFAHFTDGQLQRIELECAGTEPVCGVMVTSLALAFELHLIPIPDIVWIYEQNSTQRGVATMNNLVVVDKDQRSYRILLSTKAGPLRKADPEAVRRIMEQLHRYSPGIYFGYNRDMVRMYRQNFADMAAHVKEALNKA